jgi:hypothetical protein
MMRCVGKILSVAPDSDIVNNVLSTNPIVGNVVVWLVFKEDSDRNLVFIVV